MAIPLATTTITVKRTPTDPNLDPYDPPPERTTVASGVRAHISTARGSEDLGGSEREIVWFRLGCDPFNAGLTHLDIVEDDQTSEAYEVVWVKARFGLGLDHFEGRMKQISGVV